MLIEVAVVPVRVLGRELVGGGGLDGIDPAWYSLVHSLVELLQG